MQDGEDNLQYRNFSSTSTTGYVLSSKPLTALIQMTEDDYFSNVFSVHTSPKLNNKSKSINKRLFDDKENIAPVNGVDMYLHPNYSNTHDSLMMTNDYDDINIIDCGIDEFTLDEKRPLE